jgi:hypothetical protein
LESPCSRCFYQRERSIGFRLDCLGSSAETPLRGRRRTSVAVYSGPVGVLLDAWAVHGSPLSLCFKYVEFAEIPRKQNRQTRPASNHAQTGDPAQPAKLTRKPSADTQARLLRAKPHCFLGICEPLGASQNPRRAPRWPPDAARSSAIAARTLERAQDDFGGGPGAGDRRTPPNAAPGARDPPQLASDIHRARRAVDHPPYKIASGHSTLFVSLEHEQHMYS